MQKKGKQIAELVPTLSGREAAAIFGVQYKTFKRSLDLYLHRKIRYQIIGGGFTKRYVLVDVLRAAYPEATNHTIHIMAQNQMARINDPKIERARFVDREIDKRQREKAAAGD